MGKLDDQHPCTARLDIDMVCCCVGVPVTVDAKARAGCTGPIEDLRARGQGSDACSVGVDLAGMRSNGCCVRRDGSRIGGNVNCVCCDV